MPALAMEISHQVAHICWQRSLFCGDGKAKTKVQQTKQGSFSLTEHHSRCDRQLQIRKDMQIDLDSKWVIYIYLLTLNVSTFGHAMTTMITEMDTEDIPATLEDAKRRIDRFAQSSAQVGIHSWKQSRDTEVLAPK